VSWRHEGYKNPYPKTTTISSTWPGYIQREKNKSHKTYEEGYDAAIEALKVEGQHGKWLRTPDGSCLLEISNNGRNGTVVFIPDEEGKHGTDNAGKS